MVWENKPRRSHRESYKISIPYSYIKVIASFKWISSYSLRRSINLCNCIIHSHRTLCISALFIVGKQMAYTQYNILYGGITNENENGKKFANWRGLMTGKCCIIIFICNTINICRAKVANLKALPTSCFRRRLRRRCRRAIIWVCIVACIHWTASPYHPRNTLYDAYSSTPTD